MMGDTAYTPAQQAFMARTAPLVDEVLLAMEEVHPNFFVEEVHNELRLIFEEKKQAFYGKMGYQAWSSLIRGRLGKLGFELVKRNDGAMGWCRPEEVKRGTS